MKARLLFLFASAALSVSTLAVVAAEGEKSKSQQNRMAQCSHDAKEKGLKGEERQKYMSTCLKGNGATKEKAAPAKSASATGAGK